jgi:hypothetical protein
MKTTEHNITGTILRAGTGTEGRVTVEIETTREQLRDFPFNMIGKSAIAFIANSAPKPETPIPDADGWIPHDPKGGIPSNAEMVKFKDGVECHASGFRHDVRAWRWESNNWTRHISHYRPA